MPSTFPLFVDLAGISLCKPRHCPSLLFHSPPKMPPVQMEAEVSSCWALILTTVEYNWLIFVLNTLVSVFFCDRSLPLGYLSSTDKNSLKSCLYSAILIKRTLLPEYLSNRWSQVWTPGCWSLGLSRLSAVMLTCISKFNGGERATASRHHGGKYKYQSRDPRDAQPKLQLWACPPVSL